MLARRRASRPLAHTDQIGPRPRMAQNRPRGQIVEQHRIGAFQAVHGLQRQKFRVAGAGTDETDEAGHAPSAVMRWKKVPDTLPL